MHKEPSPQRKRELARQALRSIDNHFTQVAQLHQEDAVYAQKYLSGWALAIQGITRMRAALHTEKQKQDD